MRGSTDRGVDAFRLALTELAPSRSALLTDPEGAGWLPPSLHQKALDDPACAAVLAEYVEYELDGFRELVPVDRTFGARAVARAVGSFGGARGAPAFRRSVVLGLAYALALGVALLALGLGADLGVEMGANGAGAVDASAATEASAGLAASASQLRGSLHDWVASSRPSLGSLGWMAAAVAAFLLLRAPIGPRLAQWGGNDRSLRA